jgi:bacterioferritin-associated ferredoxin
MWVKKQFNCYSNEYKIYEYKSEMSDQQDPLADEVMCMCSGTTRGKIQKLFEQGMDAEAISRYSGALSGCGGCEWDVAEFLRELAENQAKPKE